MAHNGSSTLTITLHLNLTRFLAYQLGNAEALASQPAAEVLRIDRPHELVRRTLDGNDNCLPVSRWHEVADQPSYFAVYLAKVRELLEERIGTAFDTSALCGAAAENVRWDWSNGIIRRCEIYWEWSHENAVALVHRLRPALHTVAEDCATAIYPVPLPQAPTAPSGVRWRTRQNAIVLEVKLGAKNVELVVYAKQHNRVRMEIRYGVSLTVPLGHICRDRGIGHGFEDIPARLGIAMEDACRRMGRVLMALPPVGSPSTVPMATFVRLMGHINAACDGDQTAFRQVVTMLILNRAISEPNHEVRLASVLASLSERGVVERRSVSLRDRSQRPRYTLTAEYSMLATELSEALEAKG